MKKPFGYPESCFTPPVVRKIHKLCSTGNIIIKKIIFLLCLSLLAVGSVMAGTQNPPIFFTDAEKTWKADHPTLHLGVGTAFPPFMWVESENGRQEFKGMVSDYVDLLGERLGMDMQIIFGLSFDKALAQGQSDRIDLFPCISRTPERSEFLSFTEPYISYPLVIITQEDDPIIGGVKDLGGKRIATVKHLVVYSKMKNEYSHLNLNYVFTQKVEENLEAVSLGRADACIINLAVASYYIQKKGLTNLRIAAPVNWKGAQFSMGVRKDWPMLQGIVEKGLASISQEEKDRISQKWIRTEYELGVPIGTIWRWSLGIGVVIVGFFLLIFTWNRRLQKEFIERKKVEYNLKESERRLTTLMGNLPGMAYRCLNDKNWMMSYISEDCKDLTGYEPSELIENRVLAYGDLIVLEDRQYVWNEIQIAINENRSFTIEYRIQDKNKNEKWVWEKGRCVSELKANNSVLEGFISDITERKLAEVSLKKSEEKYRHLFENIFDVYYRTDDKGYISLISPSVEKYFGYAPGELIGRNLADFYVYPQKREEFLSLLIRDGYVENFEALLHRKDNSTIWVSTNAKMLKDKEDNSTGVEGLTRDITEYKSVEEENEMSLKRFQALMQLNQMTGAVLTEITDFALEEAVRLTRSKIGYLAFLNEDETVLSMHSWSKSAMQECSMNDKPIHYPVSDTGLWGEAVRQRKTIITNDYPAPNPLKKGTPVGHVTLLRHMSTPIFDGDKIVIVAGVGNKETAYTQTDADQISLLMQGMWYIIQRKQTEAERETLNNQLTQAQKMEAVGRLAGGVAHDFNNMLGVIIGNADLALEGLDPTLTPYDELKEIKKAGERSADLTRQLLAFARKQTVSPKVLDFNKTVAGMIRMLQRLIGEHIDLAWRPGKGVWPVKMDPSQLDQVLANLCVNARDAITDVGKVAIETGNTCFDAVYCKDHPGFLPGEFILLAFSDNGCGMDTETLNNIFEPFFTTKATGQGTGLGLATVYGVVKQNNGFVNVYSEPGEGTAFKIYLPRYRPSLDELPGQVKVPPIKGGHETILLVEDETTILKMTTLMLERLGYRVVAAGSPNEAIRLAQAYDGEIHLLMTDVVMPEMNGRDLAKNILSICPNLKQLFMSGYTANIIAHHGIVDEGVNFIQKPFSRQQLSAKVREVIVGDDV